MCENKIAEVINEKGYIKVMLDLKTVPFKEFQKKLRKKSKGDIWVKPLKKYYYKNKIICMSVIIGAIKEEHLKDKDIPI